MTIRGTTQLLGVIGDPVKHSMSPVMHNAAIAALGLDYVYLPLPVTAADLKAAVEGFRAIGLRGFNITIPHKQAIMPLLAEVSEVAQAIGAVNTVWWNGSGWSGTNTDAAGFLAPLQSLDRDWSQVTAVVLGNGGASRAVVAACHQLGCRGVQVAGRSAPKLEAFERSWQGAAPAANLSVHAWKELDWLLPEASLVVNTTPVGMAPAVEASPLNAAQIARLPADAVVYDLIYTPRPTQLLHLAAEAGFTTVDGTEMLVCQGAKALEIWVGQPPPVAVMRQALLDCLAA